MPRRRSYLDERHFGNDAAPRRRVIAAARRLTPWRRAPLGLDAARLRQLVRPRRHWSVGIVEAELGLAALLDDDDDAHMSAAFEPAEQHFLGQRLLDVLLDYPGHRPRAHPLVIAARDQPFRRFIG